MVQSGRGPCFPLKAVASLRILRQLFRQELERDSAPQAEILRFVHHSHAAAAEPLHNPVMGDGLTDHGRCLPGVVGNVRLQFRTSQFFRTLEDFERILNDCMLIS